MEKGAKVVVGVFLLIAVYGVVTRIIRSNKNRIYTVGRVYANSGPGKNGATYYFTYAIDGKEYKGEVQGLSRWSTNDSGYIFLEVLQNEHSDWQYVEFNKVPECFKAKDMPKAGWDTFPSNIACK
jgi:hypothetical protein